MNPATIFLKALLWVWQLPQHLVALVLIMVTGAKKAVVLGLPGVHLKPFGRYDVNVVWKTKKLDAGISLGNFIILPEASISDLVTVSHEHGHQIQSRVLGPFYLWTVGIFSALFNILTREKELSPETYYKRWPEDQADRLGGVIWADNIRVVKK